MKGITHFLAGIAAATFVPGVVESAGTHTLSAAVGRSQPLGAQHHIRAGGEIRNHARIAELTDGRSLATKARGAISLRCACARQAGSPASA